MPERSTHLILVPVACQDGELVPEELFDRLMLELTVKFGGYTLFPPAFGGWIDKDGKFQPDKHRPVLVIADEGREDEVHEWVKNAGRELGQEVMLVLNNFCEAHFIDVDAAW